LLVGEVGKSGEGEGKEKTMKKQTEKKSSRRDHERFTGK
jgi:hypothetical protein